MREALQPALHFQARHAACRQGGLRGKRGTSGQESGMARGPGVRSVGPCSRVQRRGRLQHATGQRPGAARDRASPRPTRASRGDGLPPDGVLHVARGKHACRGGSAAHAAWHIGACLRQATTRAPAPAKTTTIKKQATRQTSLLVGKRGRPCKGQTQPLRPGLSTGPSLQRASTTTGGERTGFCWGELTGHAGGS